VRARRVTLNEAKEACPNPWLLRSAQDDQQQVPQRPGFHLAADGRKVQGFAGCNRIAGTYDLKGDTLKFGPLIATKMACPALTTEQAFLKALDATVRYEIGDSNLTLFGADGPVARLQARPTQG
jgi:heat shock protein HslJ